MSDTLVLVLINGIVFALIAWIAYLFFNQVDDAVSEVKSKQVEDVDASLADIALSISPQVFFFLRVAAALLLFLLGTIALSAGLGLLLALAGFFAPRLIVAQLREARVKKVEQQLVEGLELMGNSLKSGLTLQQAVELLVREMPDPIRREFSLVLSETRLGVEFIEALANMGERLNSDIVRILASGVAVTKRCGGDLTVIFQNIASTIRSQANIQGKLEAVTSQGKFQGLVLSMMPFALMIILYFIDRAHIETLFGYTLGIWAVITVVVLVVLAQLWIRKLLAVDV